MVSYNEALKNDPNEKLGYIDENKLALETEKLGLYKTIVSDSSCNLEDIKGFTFGAVTSRFWLLRKHFN
jgi:hypothetical protein